MKATIFIAMLIVYIGVSAQDMVRNLDDVNDLLSKRWDGCQKFDNVQQIQRVVNVLCNPLESKRDIDGPFKKSDDALGFLEGGKRKRWWNLSEDQETKDMQAECIAKGCYVEEVNEFPCE